MKIKPDMRYSELREMTAELPDEGIRGMIRLLRLILHERDGNDECPICTWDMNGNMRQLLEKQSSTGNKPLSK